jgi:site-specific DNA-methyltransferase (adenine-specific)
MVLIGDCRKRLSEIPDNTVDLVLTSPPYAWEFRYQEKKMQLGEIYNTRLFFHELERVWRQCYRALKPGGYMCIVWADLPDARKLYGRTMIEEITSGMLSTMRSAGFDLVSEWIWRKYEPGAAINIRPYLAYRQMVTGNFIPKSASNWEYVYVWRKPSANLNPAFDMTDEEWMAAVDGVWNIPYGPEDRDPACFPVELARRVVKIYTKPYALVLDPFLGSGTTMRACVELRRSCIGIEVDESRLPRIKQKTMWGTQPLDGEAEWVIS